MTLPWLWSGEPDMAAAARSEARAAEADIVAIERRVRVEVREAVAAVDATADTLALLRTVEAPASRRALAAVESAYRAGGSSLLDWLDAARAVRELEIEEVELLVELAHAVTEVSGALGASLDVEGRTVSGDDTEAAAARDASGDGLPTPDESARPTDLGASAAPMDDTSAPFGGAR